MTVDMKSEHPRTFVRVEKATATLPACHLIYIGIVLSGRHVNLRHNHIVQLIG